MRVLTIVVLFVVCASEFSEAQAPSQQIAQPNTSLDFNQVDDLHRARLLRSSYFAAPVPQQLNFEPAVDGVPAHLATHEATGCETNQYVDPALRRHLMFGVDRKLCCDEWAGFCNCCGLKTNPGHLGIRWLRSGEACECTEPCRRSNRCDCSNCK